MKWIKIKRDREWYIMIFLTLAGFAIIALTSNPTVNYDGTNFPSLTKDLASSPSLEPYILLHEKSVDLHKPFEFRLS